LALRLTPDVDQYLSKEYQLMCGDAVVADGTWVAGDLVPRPTKKEPDMAEVPAWAETIVADVSEQFGFSEPHVTWSWSKTRYHSTGRTYPGEGRIHITAGLDSRDRKWVVLHEMAHWVTPGHKHDEKFWDAAYQLYRQYEVLQVAGDRESRSLKAAQRRARKARQPQPIVVPEPVVVEPVQTAVYADQCGWCTKKLKVTKSTITTDDGHLYHGACYKDFLTEQRSKVVQIRAAS
jgi:hypothetical protein